EECEERDDDDVRDPTERGIRDLFENALDEIVDQRAEREAVVAAEHEEDEVHRRQARDPVEPAAAVLHALHELGARHGGWIGSVRECRDDGLLRRDAVRLGGWYDSGRRAPRRSWDRRALRRDREAIDDERVVVRKPRAADVQPRAVPLEVEDMPAAGVEELAAVEDLATVDDDPAVAGE